MSINIFTVSGNVGKDAELRQTNSGKYVASFSLPCKSGYGEYEKTSWVTCKMLGGMAEKLSKYITKGSKVTVSGEFVLEEWESNGEKKKMPCLIVSSIELPAKPQQGNQSGGNSGGWGKTQEPVSNWSSNDAPTDYDQEIPF